MVHPRAGRRGLQGHQHVAAEGRQRRLLLLQGLQGDQPPGESDVRALPCGLLFSGAARHVPWLCATPAVLSRVLRHARVVGSRRCARQPCPPHARAHMWAVLPVARPTLTVTLRGPLFRCALQVRKREEGALRNDVCLSKPACHPACQPCADHVLTRALEQVCAVVLGGRGSEHASPAGWLRTVLAGERANTAPGASLRAGRLLPRALAGSRHHVLTGVLTGVAVLRACWPGVGWHAACRYVANLCALSCGKDEFCPRVKHVRLPPPPPPPPPLPLPTPMSRFWLCVLGAQRSAFGFVSLTRPEGP